MPPPFAQLSGWGGGPLAAPAASQDTDVRQEHAAIPDHTRRHVVTERTTRRWPGLKHIRRPRTRRGWLITIAASAAILALKLILGLGVLAVVVHLLTH
jgi:hypothetical protein